ncbi:14910_t:CDS:1, partial [Funneliformis caledonium]
MNNYIYFDDENYDQEGEYGEYNGEGSRKTEDERILQPFQEPNEEEKQGTKENKSVKRARTYSETWHYFNTQNPQHPTKVICQKCNQMYSKSTGISILKFHLKRVHGIKINNVKKLQTVDPLPKDEKLARDQALVDWIIADSQPFSVVTNIHFINLIKTLDQRYHLPEKSSLKEIVAERFDEMRKNV